MTPEDHVGKSVRMNGMYVNFYEEENDFRCFACIVKDATACCLKILLIFRTFSHIITVTETKFLLGWS